MMKGFWLRLVRSVRNWVHPAPPAGAEFHLIVGLGNPGKKYARNRHNIGFQCVDHLAKLHGFTFRKRFNAELGEGQIAGQKVILAKPLTFMNQSGRAVAAISRWYRIPPQRILVICDDLDLPLAKMRLRPNGSSGGHNGLKSVIAELGTQDFPRLRIGIGRPAQGDPIDYVLNDFGPDQEPLIQPLYDRVDGLVRCLLEEGIVQAMNLYNSNNQP